MKDISLLQDQLLMTLSYFEPMTMEFIYLDMDQDFLMAHPEFTMDDLQECLKLLAKQKKIKTIKTDNTTRWVRIYPRKGLIKRIIGLFR